MAYDCFLEDRLNDILRKKAGHYISKTMMGGLCYMIDSKMCVGIIRDKLLCRVGPEKYNDVLQESHCIEMAFNGKPMKGYVFIEPLGIINDSDLEKWVDLCLAYLPMAKASKKR